MSSVSTKSMLGFVDGVVSARLRCNCVVVRPKPVSRPNKTVAVSSTDCFIKVPTLLLREGGRTVLDPHLCVLYIVTLRTNGTHPTDANFFEPGWASLYARWLLPEASFLELLKFDDCSHS